jgi:hypothetical protein
MIDRRPLVLALLFLPMIANAQEAEKCLMLSKQWIIHNSPKDKAGHEMVDWTVTCYVKDGDITIWENKLPLAHPCNFREAIKAVENFMKTRAPQIYKDWKARQ